MKIRIIIVLLLAFNGFARSKGSIQHFEKKAFYSALKSTKVAEVDDELTLIGSSAVSEKQAYEGTLLMRKAGLVKIPAEKLKLFKRGRIELETAILNDKDNAEYHFLRLIIEEHAPKIVKYKGDLDADKQIVIKKYKELSPAVQQAVTEYSKDSKILQPQDF